MPWQADDVLPIRYIRWNTPRATSRSRCSAQLSRCCATCRREYRRPQQKRAEGKVSFGHTGQSKSLRHRLHSLRRRRLHHHLDVKRIIVVLKFVGHDSTTSIYENEWVVAHISWLLRSGSHSESRNFVVGCCLLRIISG
jgi:hypothetical protein